METMELKPVIQAVNHSTFVIERIYPASAERVFRALSTPEEKQRWFVEGEGFAMESFTMDFRVGGRETTRFLSGHDSPLKGASMTNETVFLDIVTDRRVVLAYTMAVADQRISASLSTFDLTPTDCGTKLVYTDQVAFFEDSDGEEMRKFGWNLLLDQLGKEVAGKEAAS